MAIHIGKKIKEELQKQHMPVSLFAQKINRSRNVVYDIFERESIDTALLNKISRVLNCDFFSAYSSQKEYVTENLKSYSHDGPISYTKQTESLKLLEQQVQILLSEITYLKKIINLLEKKSVKKKRIK